MARLRNTSGFTMLEIFIAITILTIGLLGVAGLTIGTIKGNLFSKNVTTATVIAQARQEDIQRSGYVNATTTNFPVGPDNVAMGGVIFSRTTTINNNTPAPNMKEVTVTTSWNNNTKSVVLSTILAK